MSSQKQERKVRGRLPYIVERLNIVRDRLAGYTTDEGEEPGSVVIRELVQNADDAEATLIKFSFYADRLEVYNNSSFKPQDFDNIRNTFLGSKQDIEGKIGAFGTGFLTVYHLADYPELHSVGRSWIFEEEDISELEEDNPVEKTLFVFPWRLEETEIGKKIGGKVWTPQEIDALKDAMPRLAYQLCLFLRHVRTIEVYSEETLLARLECKKTDGTSEATFVCEEWHVRLEQGETSRDDSWLFYRKQIADLHNVEGITPKDRTVSLAFPLPDQPDRSKWLRDNIPGSAL